MRWDGPTNLGKTVEVKAINRPVKIAYLVPFDDKPDTHMNLDAVFFESYTRWAGVYTLLLPTSSHEFLDEGYGEWLKNYDPDFIYSYVDIDTSFIDIIDRLSCPVAFLKHEMQDQDDRKTGWRGFLPSWDHYIMPISSITTVSSPSVYQQFPYEDRPRERTVFTQYRMEPNNRFLADNFGTGFSLNFVTHAIPGLFKTLCLVPEELPEYITAGTNRCFTTLEAFRAITDRTATPIMRFAMVHSDGIPRPQSRGWTYAYQLFVGSTPLDRINFWNSRHLTSQWSHTSNALILEPGLFNDDQLVEQLGQYLNRNNFLRNSGGEQKAEIRSISVEADVLDTYRVKLQSHTWNTVNISQSYKTLAIPSNQDLNEHIHGTSIDTTTFRLAEDFSKITANEPAHFIYIPPQLKGHSRGQWIVELDIQRHNRLSRYVNVVDTWTLPRRRKIVNAFTKRLAKPTLAGRLALLPTTVDVPFRSQAIKGQNYYDISLPSDELFFCHLALELFQYPTDDLRATNTREGYIDLTVSDKGQYLRGVISLFDHLDTAFGILTNKFWRSVLARAKVDSSSPLTFDMKDFCSLIPNDTETMQRLTKKLRFKKPKKTFSYLRDNLKDTLEYLVHSSVFHQVATWRCRYCGHLNSRSFDNMKIQNECVICSTEYLAPIELDWKYELNNFAHRYLVGQSGLPVLWTLGFLQNRLGIGSFWYLPEVDLFENEDGHENKNEIDILCMLDGFFYAVEVKQSASTLLNKDGEIDKFINVIERLRPDVALLAFERYCNEEANEQETKVRLAETAKIIREQIGAWIKLEVLVAQDVSGYNDFSVDFGWYGPRIRGY